MERYANKQNLVQLAKAVHDKYSPVATPTANGLMSAEDKVKVDGLGKTDDPTDAGPIVELTAKGWAEQDTTTGKNLFEKSNRGIEGVSVNSANGGEYTVNVLNYDGSNGFRVACTTKSPSWAYVFINVGDLRNTLATGNVDYTLSFKAKASQTFQCGIAITQMNSANTQLSFGSVDFNSSSSAIEKTATTLGVEAATQGLRIMLDNMPAGSTLDIADIQLEAGSTATSYEPYSGGAPSPSPSYPQEIRRVTGHTIAGKTGRYVDVDVQGRNLLPNMATSQTINGVTFTVNEDGGIAVRGTASARAVCYLYRNGNVALETASYVVTLGTTDVGCGYYTSNEGWKTKTDSPISLSGALVDFWIDVAANKTVDTTVYPMLVKGDTALSYEPYYHQTIPIPLPSRGWVASLPDGTCDTLALDGAGGYVWELNTGMLDLASLTWGYYTSTSAFAPYFYASIANDIIAYDGNFGNVVYPALAEDFVITRRYAPLLTDGHICFDGNTTTEIITRIQCKMTSATTVEDFMAALGDSSLLLHHLANPTTESGYVDMPTVPVHAAISSADLIDLAVRCCADEGAAEIASAWGRKYESRIAALEDAVAELIASA